jgi:hypothetical protein
MARGCIGAGLAALTLAACSGGGDPGPLGGTAPCPRIAILADGADLTRFRPGAARDLTAMVVDARIAGFEARCDFAGRDRRVLDVRITPRFEVERGPALAERSADLPWFVALSDANDSGVLERVAATTRVTFSPNVQRTQVTGRTAQLAVPVGGELRAADYVVRLSLQLTPEELEQNRQRGPR